MLGKTRRIVGSVEEKKDSKRWGSTFKTGFAKGFFYWFRILNPASSNYDSISKSKHQIRRDEENQRIYTGKTKI